MAVVITGMLGLVAWLAALIALRHSSWWGVTPAVVLLIVLTIPCLAALLLRRRAGVVHRSAAGIEAEIVEALRHPQLAAGLRSFLDDDADGDDGRAGLVRLTKGAMGVRMAIREHRGSFVDLAAAVRAMLLSPANLLVITGGMVLLVIAVAVFVLAAIF